MKVLVTGADGFLGGHLIRLLNKLDYPIRIMVKSNSDIHQWNYPVETFVADLLDADRVRKVVSGVDMVFHCAAKLPGTGDEEEIWKVNVLGTQNILNACLEHQVQRLVYISTDSVYGDGDNQRATEETPINPIYFYEGNYPRSKLAGEEYVLEMYYKHDLPVTIIRPCLLYGPGKSSGNEILRQWALKRIHFLIDGGQAKVSLCYVVDLARAIILAGTCSQAIGQCYNISDGVPYSKREILKFLEEITGRRKLFLSVPSSLAYQAFGILHKIMTCVCSNASIQLDPRRILFSAHNHVIDITKATKELNYKPQIFLREGLEKTLVWFSQ